MLPALAGFFGKYGRPDIHFPGGELEHRRNRQVDLPCDADGEPHRRELYEFFSAAPVFNLKMAAVILSAHLAGIARRNFSAVSAS
jgi:hypothetical protein